MTLKQKAFLFIFSFISFGAFGQSMNNDGNWHRINYSGTYRNLTVPFEFDRFGNLVYNAIEFRLRGADGGVFDDDGALFEGGEGASIYTLIQIENFSPNEVLRFVVGGRGEKGDDRLFSSRRGGGGGGGGTGILVNPGNNQYILAVAGGGGGASYRIEEDGSLDRPNLPGVPGSSGNCGTEPRIVLTGTDNNTYNPGCNGQGGGTPGSGGGAFSDGTNHTSTRWTLFGESTEETGGDKGVSFGGQGGQIDKKDLGGYGGYGFGGGGQGSGFTKDENFESAVREHGGGGGGYSGGASTTRGGGGGGGGSYLMDNEYVFDSFSEIAENNITNNPQNGYIEYRFINITPIAQCQNITIQLDANGQYTLDPSEVDGGSSAPLDDVLLSLDKTNFSCSETGNLQVTLTATGAKSGTSTTCQATITVLPAKINCVPQLTLILDDDGYTPTITKDDLLESIAFNHCGDFTNFTISPRTQWRCWGLGDNTVTLTATDAYGNEVSCTSTVTVVDNMAPTAVCKNATVSLDENGEASISVSTVDGGSYDNCYTPGKEFSVAISGKTSFDCSDVGPHTVYLTITDHIGLQDQCTATVTIADNIQPILTCPSNKIVSTNTDNCTYIPGGNNSDFDIRFLSMGPPVLGSVIDNCSQLQITNDYNNQSWLREAEFPIGTTTVTYTVTDPGNNTVSCSFTVTVDANLGEAPDLVSCPPQLQGTATVDHPNVLEYFVEAGTCGKVLSFDDPIFSDCDDFIIERIGGYPSGTAFPVGTTDFYFRAVDEQGNRSDNGQFRGPSCVTRIIVKEAIPPVAKCKESLTIELDFPLDPSVGGIIRPSDLDNGSFDECGGGLTMRILENSTRYSNWVLYCDDYAFRPLTLEVSDRFGNSSTCTTQVKLGEQPVAVCKDIEVNVGGGNRTISVADIYTGAPFSPCIERFPPSMSLDRNTFGCADVGEQSVILTVTDVNGKTTTCASKVNVIDGGISSLNCGPVIQVVLEEGDQETIDISNHYSASDICSDVTVVAQQDLVTVDCDDIGQNLILVTATDGNWNTATCNVRIQVSSPDWTAKCENLTVELDQNGQAVINHRSILSFGDQCSTDPKIAEYNQYLRYNVRNFSGGEGFINGAEFTQDYTLTMTSNDAGDNRLWMRVYDTRTNVEKECISTITVIDNPAPIAICQSATVYLDDQGAAALAVADVDGGSYDENGTIVSSILDVTSFSCTEIQNNPQTVTLTVTDDGGKTASCQASVTVVDKLAPVVSTKNITVELDANGQAGITAGQVDNGSSDNCGVAAVTVSPSSFDCSNKGANTVTLTVTDVNGNISTGTATVTVEDKVAPVITCQDLTVELVNGQASIPTSAILFMKNDNCGEFKTVETKFEYFDCSHAGQSIAVSHFVFDQSGNEASCTANVKVVEKEVPEAICQDVTVYLDASGNGFTTAAAVNNGSSDACGIANLSLDNNSFDCSNIGSNNTVTLTVTDKNDNESTCTAFVTVIDDKAPTAQCQNISVMLDAVGQASITADQVDNHSSDNCSITSRTIDVSTFGTSDVGEQMVTLTLTDPSGNSSNCTAKVFVNKRPVGLSLTGDDSGQYSDQVSFSAVLKDALNGQVLANRMLTFKLGTQTERVATNSAGKAIVSFILREAPGNYEVTVSYDGDPLYLERTNKKSLEVTQENALAYYTGPSFVSTGSSKSSVATIRLTATIEDFDDTFRGNIRKAEVYFVDRDKGRINSTPLTVNAISQTVGTVVYEWTVDIGRDDADQFTIGIEVGNYYIFDNSEEDVIINVAKALNEEFVTGGGYLTLSSSAGSYAGGSGTKNNFGFNIKYNKKGTNLQGKIRTLFRRYAAGGTLRTYQIKGNQMESLSVQDGYAEFTGKANVQDVTNPDSPIPVAGNGFFIVKMHDRGESGTSDNISFALYDRNGALIFTNKWSGSIPGLQTLSGGNLKVHSGKGKAISTVGNQGNTYKEQAATLFAEAITLEAFPNPFSQQLTIEFLSPREEQVNIHVFNLHGQLVRNLFDGQVNAGEHMKQQWDGTDRSGMQLPSGMYLVRLQAGEEVVNKRVLLQR